MSKPIGALVKFEWVDTDPPVQDIAYFSFGDYDDVSETDSYGVPDTEIFYYVDGAEEGLKEMMHIANPVEFKIVSYELTYPMQKVVVTSGEFPSIESKESLYIQAEKLYEAILMHFGLYDEYVIQNPDGTTENTAKGEELYFLIEDTLKGE